MNSSRDRVSSVEGVELWLDPVCPYSWNTARWLVGVVGHDFRLHLMSLAVLNEGQTLQPPQRKRMEDSRRIGRLFTSIESEVGQCGLITAYFAFGAEYFDAGAPADDRLADKVLAVAGTHRVTSAVMLDTDLDAIVRQCHQESQDALGMSGGSPMLTVGGVTSFGPVLTSVPEADAGNALFDAVVTLAATPQFSQLQRPRAQHSEH